MNLFKDLVKSKKFLTDKLFDEVSDIDIYCELSGIDFEVGRPVSSPLRDDDSVASFSLFIPTKYSDVRPEEIWWRDFARGSGNVFKFVRLYAEEHFDICLDNRKEIIEFIDGQLNLGLFDKSLKKIRNNKVLNYDFLKESKEILFQSRPYTRMDLFWWIQYGIDQSLLEAHDVRSVKHLLNEDLIIKYTYGTYELAFAYVVYDKVKIYCPNDIAFKWRNTCPSHYLLGAQQCTRDDVLIITKSLKDIMTFKSFMNCDALAPQAESLHINKEVINTIKSRYKIVYVVMDYDEAGIKAADALEDYGFIVRWVDKTQILINNKLKVMDKDISDYIKNRGIIAGIKHMKKMFHELAPNMFRDDRVKLLLEMKNKLSS